MVAEGTIGIAADFYRLRMIRLDEEEGLDLDWRDDILFRDPPTQEVAHRACFVVQAVEIADEERTHRLQAFEAAPDAEEYLDAAREDLPDLTRAEFEARHFPQT